MSEKKRRKVKVRCTWDVEINVPAEWDRHDIEFYVEENGCPVGVELEPALMRVLKKMDEVITKTDDGRYCWACGWHDELGAGLGENKVVEIEGMTMEAT